MCKILQVLAVLLVYLKECYLTAFDHGSTVARSSNSVVNSINNNTEADSKREENQLASPADWKNANQCFRCIGPRSCVSIARGARASPAGSNNNPPLYGRITPTATDAQNDLAFAI